MNPIVSVIVPTFNRPQLLERALESIQRQTFSDYEIIVINDAGVDVSEIVSKFDKAIYIKHDKNSGLSKVRNSGIEVAKGKYITFLDDDDTMLCNHLQILVDAMNNGAKAAYSDAYLWENDKEYKDFMSIDYSYEALHQHNLFPVMCVMIRSDILKDYRFDETLPSHEDYDLWLRLSEVLDFVHIPVKTALYSRRNTTEQMSYCAYHVQWFHKVRNRYV